MLAATITLPACANRTGPDPRTLHYIGDTLVQSPLADARAYEAYLHARMAMDTDPPNLARAHRFIDRAIQYDRRDPHLWTTRGEIELRMGRLEQARRSSQKALSLRPGYPPAQNLLARLDHPDPGTTTAQASSAQGKP